MAEDTPILTDPDEEIWRAPDGTHWICYAPTREWTGWVPGEDGTWTWDRARFRSTYPDAPNWDGWND